MVEDQINLLFQKRLPRVLNTSNRNTKIFYFDVLFTSDVCGDEKQIIFTWD